MERQFAVLSCTVVTMAMLWRGDGAFFSPQFTPSPFCGAMGCIGALLIIVHLARRLYVVLLTARAADTEVSAFRVIAQWVPRYSFTGERFFCADGAPSDVTARRIEGWKALQREMMGPEQKRQHAEALSGLSDIRFSDSNRVPFPFQPMIHHCLQVGSLLLKSHGACGLTDVQGAESIDISGSYGVNVAGYEKYKEFVRSAQRRIGNLSPAVLGPLHPQVTEVVEGLRAVSGLEEVSFHGSGTEAVMSAVRTARFNTQRKLIVLFSNTYHGWWDGVVTRLRDDTPEGVLALKNRDPLSLRVVKARSSEIAAVLVDPYTCFNGGAGLSDSALFDASMRDGGVSGQSKQQASAAALARASGGGIRPQVEAHSAWLLKLRAITASASIPLIFDEVYSGFRIAHGGGQEFFGVEADLVAYGKTLGGGMPIGVVCGKTCFMRRFDELRPFRVSPIIGTFSAAPLTLGATAEFLAWHKKPSTKDAYVRSGLATATWVEDTNAKFQTEAIPVRLVSLSTVWTILFDAPGRYHWLYSYYLRSEGLSVSWIGTGRCSFPVDFADSPETGRRVQAALLRAGTRMRKDGWWWAGDTKSPLTTARIKKQMAGEFAFTVLMKSARALGFKNIGQGSGIVVGPASPELMEVPSAAAGTGKK